MVLRLKSDKFNVARSISRTVVLIGEIVERTRFRAS